MIVRKETYDLFWYFACERQDIFYNKLMSRPKPWTSDPILQTYKFCNAYRVNDRVSQYLLKNVIYNGNIYKNGDMIFRIFLFKLFNKPETWELLCAKLGDITLKSFNFDVYSKILCEAKNKGLKIYNDAYISCANKAFGYDKKHDNHLALLHKMFIVDKMQDKIIKAKTMGEAFDIIRNYPLIGDFMAYQLITDVNYSEATNYSETSFTVPGPGSIRGINKCFKDLKKMSYADVIKWVCDNQEKEFKRLGLEFKKIGNRSLQYIDCQNLFCEFDKYCRVARPELKSNRQKIKKKYEETNKKIDYIYPPKWDIFIV